MNKNDVPGMSVTISYADSVIFSQGFGYADLENKIPIDPSKTKFRIASITKTITAASIGKLVELDSIDFDKSVYEYLDSLPQSNYSFTIREVGGHIAGLERNPKGELFHCSNTYSQKDFYSTFKKEKLLFAPSSQYSYSNYGFKLLGLIIEKECDGTIRSCHKKFVIDPIGLENTVQDSGKYDSSTTKFYMKYKGKLVNAPCMDCTFKHAQGCYLSTSEDLVKLGNAFLHPGKILKKETLISLIKENKLSNGKGTGYGFGFISQKDFYGNYFFGHNGQEYGAKSYYRVYPNSKLVIAILANNSEIELKDLITEVSYNYISHSKSKE